MSDSQKVTLKEALAIGGYPNDGLIKAAPGMDFVVDRVRDSLVENGKNFCDIMPQVRSHVRQLVAA